MFVYIVCLSCPFVTQNAGAAAANAAPTRKRWRAESAGLDPKRSWSFHFVPNEGSKLRMREWWIQVRAKPFLFISTAQGAKHLQGLSQSEADFSDAVKAGKHLQIVADTRQSWTTIS